MLEEKSALTSATQRFKQEEAHFSPNRAFEELLQNFGIISLSRFALLAAARFHQKTSENSTTAGRKLPRRRISTFSDLPQTHASASQPTARHPGLGSGSPFSASKRQVCPRERVLSQQEFPKNRLARSERRSPESCPRAGLRIRPPGPFSQGPAGANPGG